jgi:hypothetical protein
MPGFLLTFPTFCPFFFFSAVHSDGINLEHTAKDSSTAMPTTAVILNLPPALRHAKGLMLHLAMVAGVKATRECVNSIWEHLDLTFLRVLRRGLVFVLPDGSTLLVKGAMVALVAGSPAMSAWCGAFSQSSSHCCPLCVLFVVGWWRVRLPAHPCALTLLSAGGHV